MLTDRRPILLANARIIDPSRDFDGPGDVLIADGLIRDLKRGVVALGGNQLSNLAEIPSLFHLDCVQPDRRNLAPITEALICDHDVYLDTSWSRFLLSVRCSHPGGERR